MTIETAPEVEIGRPAETVFAEVVAVERYPAWLRASGVVDVEREDDAPLFAGSRFFVTQRVAGSSARLEAVVIALEEPIRFGFRAVDERGIALEVDATIVPDGLRCRLRWAVRIALPLRLRLLEAMARPEVVRAAAIDLEALRRLLDSVAESA